MKWVLRLVLLVPLAVAAIVAFVLWAVLWPAPGGALRPRCPPRVHRCTVVSGRVAFHESFGPRSRTHLVLLSTRSFSLPWTTLVEFSQLARTPPGVGLGDWVSIAGSIGHGQHGEHELHVITMVTSTARVHCKGVAVHGIVCHEHNLDDDRHPPH
jgi:hypothetical protein